MDATDIKGWLDLILHTVKKITFFSNMAKKTSDAMILKKIYCHMLTL